MPFHCLEFRSVLLALLSQQPKSGVGSLAMTDRANAACALPAPPTLKPERARTLAPGSRGQFDARGIAGLRARMLIGRAVEHNSGRTSVRAQCSITQEAAAVVHCLAWREPPS